MVKSWEAILAIGWFLWSSVLIALTTAAHVRYGPSPPPIPLSSTVHFEAKTSRFSGPEYRVPCRVEIVVDYPSGSHDMEVTCEVTRTDSGVFTDLQSRKLTIHPLQEKFVLEFGVWFKQGGPASGEIHLELSNANRAELGLFRKHTVRVTAEREVIPVVTPRVSQPRVVEGDPTPVEFYVELDQPAPRAFSIGFDVRGSAKRSTHYVLLDPIQTFEIRAGQERSESLRIRIEDDDVSEPERELTFSLRPHRELELAAISRVRVAIVDNDQPILAVSLSPTVIDENSTRPWSTLIAKLDSPALETVTIRYKPSGTATEGEDYEPLSGTLVIGKGGTETEEKIRVMDDTLYETDETINLRVTAPEGMSLITSDTLSLRIVDDDKLMVSLALSTDRLTEGPEGDSATLTAKLNSKAAAPVTLRYKTSGTATADMDYEPLSGTLTIPSGQTQETLTVTVRDDAVPEPAEHIVLDFEAPPGATFSSSDTWTIQIFDNDRISFDVGLEEGQLSEAAPDNRTAVIVRLNAAPADRISIRYRVTGTATAGEDFEALSGEVIVDPGKKDARVSIVALDDDELEGEEQIELQFESSSNVTLSDAGRISVAIQDDEATGSALILLPATEHFYHDRRKVGDALAELIADADKRNRLVGKSLFVVNADKTWTQWAPAKELTLAKEQLFVSATAVNDMFNPVFDAAREVASLVKSKDGSSAESPLVLFVIWYSLNSPEDLASLAPREPLRKPDPNKLGLYIYWLGDSDSSPGLEKMFGPLRRGSLPNILYLREPKPLMAKEISEIIEKRQKPE